MARAFKQESREEVSGYFWGEVNSNAKRPGARLIMRMAELRTTGFAQ